MTADEKAELERLAIATYDKGIINGLTMALVLIKAAPTLAAAKDAIEHLRNNPPT